MLEQDDDICARQRLDGGDDVVTRTGRRRLQDWLGTPVPHLRDVRSELLLKLVIGEHAGVDPRPLLRAQRDVLRPMVAALAAEGGPRSRTYDFVAVWGGEQARSVQRFLDRTLAIAEASGVPAF